MAIPIGTTSRQVEWLARWALTGMMTLGMMAWWWPGYRSWGSAVAGLALVLALWLTARIVGTERRVPGHPVHLVMLVPAGILIVHLGLDITSPARHIPTSLQGAIDASMITWLGLLSLGVLLTQSLLPRAASHTVVLGASGAAMMLGPAAAMLVGPTAPVKTALTMLGFAGVCVWLTMLWGLGENDTTANGDLNTANIRKPHRFLRGACIAVAVVATGALAIEAPLGALLAMGITAGTLFVAGLVFPSLRVLLLLVGGMLAVGVVAALSFAQWVRHALVELIVQAANGTAFGLGENAFREIGAGNSGLAVLVGMVGWVGTVSFIGGLGLCLVWMLFHARRGHWGDQGRAIVWSVAAGCAVAALISPGGLFIPATTLATAFILGLLPVMLGRPARHRPGLWMLAAIAAMMLLMGLAPKPGLFSWVVNRFSRGDTLPHIGMGFLTAMLLAWQMGKRRVWLGLVGIVLAALLGGPAELAQYLASNRTAEFRDWVHHVMGSAAAIAPYLLCVMARWCESADARPAKVDMA